MTRTTHPHFDGQEWTARRGTGKPKHILRLTLSAGSGHEVTDEIGAAAAVRNAGDDDRLDGYRSQILSADRRGWANDALSALVETAKRILAHKNELQPENVEIERVVVREQDTILTATPS